MTIDFELGARRYVAEVVRDGNPSEVHVEGLYERSSPDVQVSDPWVEAAALDAAADAGV